MGFEQLLIAVVMLGLGLAFPPLAWFAVLGAVLLFIAALNLIAAIWPIILISAVALATLVWISIWRHTKKSKSISEAADAARLKKVSKRPSMLENDPNWKSDPTLGKPMDRYSAIGLPTARTLAVTLARAATTNLCSIIKGN